MRSGVRPPRILLLQQRRRRRRTRRCRPSHRRPRGGGGAVGSEYRLGSPVEDPADALISSRRRSRGITSERPPSTHRLGRTNHPLVVAHETGERTFEQGGRRQVDLVEGAEVGKLEGSRSGERFGGDVDEVEPCENLPALFRAPSPSSRAWISMANWPSWARENQPLFARARRFTVEYGRAGTCRGRGHRTVAAAAP